jgi:hypothetical protein
MLLKLMEYCQWENQELIMTYLVKRIQTYTNPYQRHNSIWIIEETWEIKEVSLPKHQLKEDHMLKNVYSNSKKKEISIMSITWDTIREVCPNLIEVQWEAKHWETQANSISQVFTISSTTDIKILLSLPVKMLLSLNIGLVLIKLNSKDQDPNILCIKIKILNLEGIEYFGW